MAPRVILALLAVLAAVVPALAYKCDGEIYGYIDDDVYVSGDKTCYLKDGCEINGTVYLRNGANLHSRGRVSIKGIGGINGRQSGWLDIGGHLKVQQVDIFQGKGASFYGAYIYNGELKIEASVGDLWLCDTRVSDVVEFKENTGNFYATSQWWAVRDWWGCSESKFFRDVKIEFLTGDVHIVDNDIEPGELYIKGVTGSTTIKDLEATKMKIEKNEGEIYMDDVEAYEAEIKENYGGVKLYDTEFGKLKCIGNSDVTGYDNEFDLGEGQCAPGKLTR